MAAAAMAEINIVHAAGLAAITALVRVTAAVANLMAKRCA